jgi:hypothetical protein
MINEFPHTLPTKQTLWRLIVEQSVYLLLLVSITSVTALFCFVGIRRWGHLLIVIGVSISFISSVILAVPSTPMLRNNSMTIKFLDNLLPAYNKIRQLETVREGDKGFEQLLQVIEWETSDSFRGVKEIHPIGRNALTSVEIRGDQHDVGERDILNCKKRLENGLESLCYTKGIKILSLGFFIQILGAITLAMTV